ncbi:RecD-like DNA helicase YrrC [hydrothermal vent metagenome]|uniref:RecD-like DNA helicase YrrC n=1 Tax=hydrothermal vent metagenome TaxID=652676 RepID=A0A3B0ZBD2_9ZZZZ
MNEGFDFSDDASVEQLTGVIERIAFHNDENGFSVLKVKLPTEEEAVTVVGAVALAKCGDHVEATGVWINNKVYGLQLKAEQIRIVPPATLEGVERYLCSGMIPGIGEHFAELLIRAFGADVFDVIENHPKRLAEVQGIGPKRATKIIESWDEQRAARDVMVFLQSHGIGPARAVRIYKTYGDQAVERIMENPYRLASDIHGVGFKLADQLALSLGLPEESVLRARAGVIHQLKQLALRGHCAAFQAPLVDDLVKLLNVSESKIIEAIELEVRAGLLVKETLPEGALFFLSTYHAAETGIADKFLKLTQGQPSWFGLELESELTKVEKETGLALSSSQAEAVKTVLTAKVSVITGGPGVGKTTVVNSIIKLVRAHGTRVCLCAPTGRAAKRLSETTGLEAKTVHRLLEFDPHSQGFKLGQHQPLETDLVVVDEASMVDLELMYALVSAIPQEAALLLIGDQDQLPSVGPGAILADIIQSNCIPTVCLTEIFRQAKTSNIIVNAHRINHGEMLLEPKAGVPLDDFYFIACKTPEQIHDKLLTVVTSRIPERFGFHPIQDIQVLTPMNKGGLGTRSLNVELQKRLNQNKGPVISRQGINYALGDKVIQTVNNYDKAVFNGDIGFIEHINAADRILSVNFDGQGVEYTSTELTELSLAYATTIHKSQGSEYPAVVVLLSTQHYTLLERNLLYTAVTRGKELVVVIAQPRALELAIGNVRVSSRVTRLAERLTSR